MKKLLNQWINLNLGFPKNDPLPKYLEFHDMSILENMIADYSEYCGRTNIEDYLDSKSGELLKYFKNDMDKVCDVLNILLEKTSVSEDSNQAE